ncbi:sugar ABC transporter substrate-binding protein [Celeribacter sp.]|uniref:sugar ABC transporter substrate-binding protein n=1 Tax=Celeribacter sp. TaxID=1890673 RepID=UPI003A9275B2
MTSTFKLMGCASALGLAIAGAANAQETGPFGHSSNGLSFPFAAAIAKGFADAAAEVGAEAIILDSQGDVLKQTNDIDDLLAQGVVGISVLPNDSVVATAWADKAAAAGVPFVASAGQVGDPTTRPIDDVYEGMAALVTQHEVTAGHQIGLLAAKLLDDDKTAKVAVIEGAAGYAEVGLRTEGFEAGMKEAGQPYEIVAAQPGDWTSEKGESACQNILASNPDVDLFFNQADDMVVGCARAVDAAGSDALLLGFGGSKLAIQAIKDGAVDGTVCYKPEEIGRLSFNVLHDIATGTADHKEEFVTYETPAVTIDNIDLCVGQW